MNRKWSTTILGGTALVALVLGFLIPKILNFSPAPSSRAASQMKAVINRNSSDNSCQQYAGPDFGHVVKYAFPLLHVGDSVVWHGEVDGGPPNAKVEVQFSPALTPFAKNKFGEDDPSGPVGSLVAPRDYPFLTVSVNGTPCSSFTEPGVHVDP
jgi:hypothetical protein